MSAATQGDPAAVEAVLARCIERARAAGVTIICGAYEIRALAPGGTLLGCCPLTAANICGEHLPLSEDPVQQGARQVAIAKGFDDVMPNTEGLDEWWELGARLRERYQPVAASTLEGRS